MEQQNLGQGLQVFKYTIRASTRRQGEFSAIVCRLLKYLRGNIHILKWVISDLTRLQVPQTSERFQPSVCGTTEHSVAQALWKML